MEDRTMSMDKWLYNFARKKMVEYLAIQGRSTTIGAETFSVLLKDASGMILLATGTTVPTDAGAGFAKGCIFIDTDVGAGTSGTYVNIGSITACNFDVTGTITSASVATASIADAAVTFAKMQALTTGSIIIGVGDVAAALDIKTSGKIVIGNGTTGVLCTVSGDATLASGGALTIGANAVTSAKLDEKTVQYAEVAIAAADIVATGAGKFGHAQGYPLVAAPGATKVIELISAVMIYDWDTSAQYGGGGNISITYDTGGTTLTGIIAGTALTAAADSITYFPPLAAAATSLTKNKGLNLVAASAFTSAGAVGVIRVKVSYRVHTHGLA
jgi:hypothetical protein